MFPKLLRTELKLIKGTLVPVRVYEGGFAQHKWWGSPPSVYPSQAQERVAWFHEPEGFDSFEEGIKIEAGRRYYLKTGGHR
jgi:hypothetical protein